MFCFTALSSDTFIPISIDPHDPIFRIGRRLNPWEPPDWSLAGPDGTFGNRFDDPEGTYRILYASSQRLGCYLETLARFRVDITLYAELANIEGEDDFVSLGQVPVQWIEKRIIGSAEHEGSYADLYGSEWIGLLRQALAADCLALGINDLDAAVLQGSAPRKLTASIVGCLSERFRWNSLPIALRPRRTELGALRTIQTNSRTEPSDRANRS